VTWVAADARGPAPGFPAEIPGFSDKMSFDILDFVADNATLLGTFDYLRRKLNSGELPYSFSPYPYSDGFVLVTRPERFDIKTLAPLRPPFRWNLFKLTPQWNSPRGWLRMAWELVDGQKGHFRQFVFVIAKEVNGPGRGADFDSAQRLYQGNLQDFPLPESMQTTLLQPRRCRVFVYHYKTFNGFDPVLQTLKDGTPSCVDQLRGAKLLEYLEREPGR
jgi:hypothetical protein